MDLNHVRQLMRSLYWSTWEREYQLATARARSPWGNYSRSMMEAATSMEKAPGINPRPGRVPEQELLTPETWFRMATELWNFFGEIVDCYVSFRSGAIYSPKGVVRRCTRWRHHPWGRPRLKRAEAWCGGCGPPPDLSFWLPESSGVLEFLYFFQIFLSTSIFWTFSAIHRHNKQKLALWLLVNRLVQ